MAERLEKPWLPESYAKFQDTDSKFHKWCIPNKIIWAAWIGASIWTIFSPEYARHFLQPHVLGIGIAAFLATAPNPSFPSFNFVGRRLYRQLYEIGIQIFKNDNLPQTEEVIGRVRKTLDFAGTLTPINTSFDANLTPAERLDFFPKPSNITLRPTDRVIIRKALYIGEAYWQTILDDQSLPKGHRDYANTMAVEIKNYLAALSTDRHFS